MIERTRPERPPYVPRWLLPTVLGAFVLSVVVIAVIVVTGMRGQVEVPDVVGLDESVARVRLAQAGLGMEIGERPFDASEPGTVLDQAPPAGSSLSHGDAVVLVVSEGTEEFPMPDLVGLSIRIAKAQLESRGLTIKIETVESDAPSDTVIATNPSPGATLRSTDIVRLTVAQAPDASNALLPFALTGASFVIDPTVVPGAKVDITMEIARRLRS
ncbi:PASTA domain-containing protein, partial [bacterium]|nr:PASTA domain-containing protein [bacterium]